MRHQRFRHIRIGCAYAWNATTGVLLVSSGKQIEIGSFLGPAERVELAMTLKRLLAAANGRYR